MARHANVEVDVSTTYLASVALEEVERAQAELERHLTVRPTGECVTCGQVEPCSGRQEAGTTFIKPSTGCFRVCRATHGGCCPISWFALPTDSDGHELSGTGSEA
ncbi:hypothetical protein AB0A95_29350 [Micromonospora sp. NPDC049230]|uniref:hypothetical protein n=1 Tax=Micromonospora sp. NPDC049230 TaxID=3155502 RepID=UPI0033C91044